MARSVHGAILDQIQKDLRGVELPGIPADNIIKFMAPSDLKERWKGYPGVMLAPVGSESIDPGAGTAAKDDIGYPVLVAILDRAKVESAQGKDAKMDTWLYWRQLVIDTFIHKRLAITITGLDFFDTTIEPADIVDLGAWQDPGIMASLLVLRVWARKQRRL